MNHEMFIGHLVKQDATTAYIHRVVWIFVSLLLRSQWSKDLAVMVNQMVNIGDSEAKDAKEYATPILTFREEESGWIRELHAAVLK